MAEVICDDCGSRVQESPDGRSLRPHNCIARQVERMAAPDRPAAYRHLAYLQDLYEATGVCKKTPWGGEPWRMLAEIAESPTDAVTLMSQGGIPSSRTILLLDSEDKGETGEEGS